MRRQKLTELLGVKFSFNPFSYSRVATLRARLRGGPAGHVPGVPTYNNTGINGKYGYLENVGLKRRQIISLRVVPANVGPVLFERVQIWTKKVILIGAQIRLKRGTT
jgi:hypothetical protein